MNSVKKSIASILVDQARAKIKEKLFTFNKQVKKINVTEIPEEFEQFFDTNYFWKKVSTPNGSLDGTCIFYCPDGGVFSEHCHPNQVESILVLKGCLQCITAQEIRTINSGEFLEVGKNVVHKIQFKKNTTCIIAWYPAFPKWEASFGD